MNGPRTRRAFLTCSVLGTVASAGCVTLGSSDGATKTTEFDDATTAPSRNGSATETSTPALPDCGEARTPSVPAADRFEEWNPEPPGDLSEGEAVRYVTAFEAKYKERRLAGRHRNADSIYVGRQGSTSVETVRGGYLVEAEMGGYYNRPVGTATEHADLYYEVRYLLTPTAVVRVKDAGGLGLDPRSADVGTVVLCVPGDAEIGN